MKFAIAMFHSVMYWYLKPLLFYAGSGIYFGVQLGGLGYLGKFNLESLCLFGLGEERSCGK